MHYLNSIVCIVICKQLNGFINLALILKILIKWNSKKGNSETVKWLCKLSVKNDNEM